MPALTSPPPSSPRREAGFVYSGTSFVPLRIRQGAQQHAGLVNEPPSSSSPWGGPSLSQARGRQGPGMVTGRGTAQGVPFATAAAAVCKRRVPPCGLVWHGLPPVWLQRALQAVTLLWPLLRTAREPAEKEKPFGFFFFPRFLPACNASSCHKLSTRIQVLLELLPHLNKLQQVCRYLQALLLTKTMLGSTFTL